MRFILERTNPETGLSVFYERRGVYRPRRADAAKFATMHAIIMLQKREKNRFPNFEFNIIDT